MAKKRRSYKVNSTDYNIAGGGGGASGDVVRFMQKETTSVSGGGNGVLYTPGTEFVANPIKVYVEAGLAITSDEQTNSTVYYDHAFEMNNVSASQVNNADELPTGYGTEIPSGLSVNNQQDSNNNSQGYTRLSGTVGSNVAEGSYKFRYEVSQQGWTKHYIDYEVVVWPPNTTPTWSNSSFTEPMIIKNYVTKQYLTVAPTATQAVGFAIKSFSGFLTGVEPKVEDVSAGADAGRIYVENTPNTAQGAVTHNVTMEVDLGAYGKMEKTFSGSLTYGDPVGQLYIGPASISNWGNSGVQLSSTYRYTGAYSPQSSYQSSPYGSTAWRPIQGSSPSVNYLTDNARGPFGGRGADAQYYYDWVVPNGVTSFCVVAVGGGAGGCYNWSSYGGGGGGTCWVNDVTCNSGETFRVYIGTGGSVTANDTTSGGVAGGASWMVRSSNGEVILKGYGGGGYNYHGNAGNVTSHSYAQYTNNTQQMNPGSASVSTAYGTYGANYGGESSRSGGGAAGYSGQGGNPSTSGSGGGGGGGQNYSSTYGYPAGGGIGLDGQGGNGDSGSSYSGSDWTRGKYYSGGGGSGGHRGRQAENPFQGNAPFGSQSTHGGEHGGGAGGSGTSWGGGYGANGGVRIIWGTGRSYPSNALTVQT
jgi:hypothetical protein